jgi:hypothetical protein
MNLAPQQNSVLNSLKADLVRALQLLGIMEAKETSEKLMEPTSTLNFPPMILKWIAAIKQWEGSKPELHNGGNLKFTTLTKSWGATQGPAAADGGYLCQFATEEMGDTALGNFLTLGCDDELVAFHAPAARTLAGFTIIYAGNPPAGYIAGIEEGLSVPGTTLISTFLN